MKKGIIDLFALAVKVKYTVIGSNAKSLVLNIVYYACNLMCFIVEFDSCRIKCIIGASL